MGAFLAVAYLVVGLVAAKLRPAPRRGWWDQYGLKLPAGPQS